MRSLIRTVIAGAVLGVFVVMFSLAQAQAEMAPYQGPHFRKGLWHFERTLYYLSRSSKAPLRRQEMTRCVDPTLAMKGIFASPDVGSCHSAMPRMTDNRYVFSMRCDYMGPARTEITVKNDSAYIEVNEIVVGNFPREDRVVAHRIGECDKLEIN